MSHSYFFTAIRGVQAGREFYSAMCPMNLIAKIFLFDEEELRPELRAQRVLNRTRVPEIARYIVENPRDYCFSALTASVDGEVDFDPIKKEGESSDVGFLKIPMSARFLLNDGQHRRAAIEEALKIRPELANECVPVVFFIDTGLRRSQQMFADLNTHAVKPSLSIGVLYDHRDPLSRLSVAVCEVVSVFRDMTEKEKTSISNRSTKLFTLSGIYHANRTLLHKRFDLEKESAKAQEALVAYWEAVSEFIPEWKRAQTRKVAAADLREDAIHAHAIALSALAVVGNDLIKKSPKEMRAALSKLSSLDWSRTNAKLWEGRALTHGRVSKAIVNQRRTANVIKKHLGLSLSEDDLIYEDMSKSDAVTIKVRGRKSNEASA